MMNNAIWFIRIIPSDVTVTTLVREFVVIDRIPAPRSYKFCETTDGKSGNCIGVKMSETVNIVQADWLSLEVELSESVANLFGSGCVSFI